MATRGQTAGKQKVIVLVDMDCFYVQVEKKLHPELVGKPCAVVQYKKWQGGGIIAVDYEARKYGVTRLIKGDEAKRRCPQIQLARVPEKRGKADLTNYRNAGTDVIKVLSRFSSIIEKASIDEAFLDITDIVTKRIKDLEFCRVEAHSLSQTHVAGLEKKTGLTSFAGFNEDVDSDEIPEPLDVSEVNKMEADVRINEEFISEQENENSLEEKKEEEVGKEFSRVTALSQWLEDEGNGHELMLAVGALVAKEMRQAVFDETGFTCSAGIGHNKMLAKLSAGMNKPNQQTILPMSQVSIVFDTIPFSKVRHLGGKLGESVQKSLSINYVGQLQNFSLKDLKEKFGIRTGSWLHEISQGIDHEPVRTRTIPKSISCGKNFPGREKLNTAQKVVHWLNELGSEIIERLEIDRKEHSRRAGLLSVHFLPDGSSSSLSRSFPLHHYDVKFIVDNGWMVINKGHCIAGKVDPNGHTPLGWTSGLLNLFMCASKFSQCSSDTGSRSIQSFIRTTLNSETTSVYTGTTKYDQPNVKQDDKTTVDTCHSVKSDQVNVEYDKTCVDIVCVDSANSDQMNVKHDEANKDGVSVDSDETIVETQCQFYDDNSSSFIQQNDFIPKAVDKEIFHSLPLEVQSDIIKQSHDQDFKPTIHNKPVSLNQTSNINNYFSSKPNTSEHQSKGKIVDPRCKGRARKTPDRKSHQNIAKYFSPVKRQRQPETGSSRDLPSPDSVDSIEDHRTIKKTKIMEDVVNTTEHDISLFQCYKCGDKMLKLAAREHLDYHYALELQESL